MLQELLLSLTPSMHQVLFDARYLGVNADNLLASCLRQSDNMGIWH
jgi:hypothetical protein